MKVIVYGTLKQGYGNHHYLRSATYLGTETLKFNGRMFCVGFPVLMKSRSKIQVEVEVYKVDAATFAALDRLEGQGHMYMRKRKKLADGSMSYYYQGMNRFWQARAMGKTVYPQADGVVRWSGRS